MHIVENMSAVNTSPGGYLPSQAIFGLGQESLFGPPSGSPPGVRTDRDSAFFGLGQESLFGPPSGSPAGVRYPSSMMGLGQEALFGFQRGLGQEALFGVPRLPGNRMDQGAAFFGLGQATPTAGTVLGLSIGLLIGGFVGAIIGQIGAGLGSKVVPLNVKMKR